MKPNEQISYTPITEEQDYRKRSYNWKTAIGLQQVDGLVPSEYLVELANLNIKGEISLDEVRNKLQNYYAHKPITTTEEERQKEADLVSQRISELLSENAFTLSTMQLLAIHKHLFDGIYDFAGKIRTYNITKKEYVLNGKTVEYGDKSMLKEMLDHDIAQEKKFDYSTLNAQQQLEHFAKFTSDFWQIHCFAEGNTRTIAVFAIKYLRKLGYNTSNDLFEKYSFYFRNALVRANYTNLKNNIHSTITPLVAFFENLLQDKKNELKSRDLVVEKQE
jgi:fido (protein-threonine AMPylation protein)